MRRFDILLVVIPIILGSGCSNHRTDGTSHLPDNDSVISVVNSNFDNSEKYESQMFCYPEDNELVEVCPVYYYVSNDTIYTSEKYHYLNYYWSSDKDNTMTSSSMLFFDREQQPNKDGWYSMCIVDPDTTRDHTGSHLSAIILRVYYGPLHPHKGYQIANADAYLYNTTKEIARSSDRNVVTPEIKKMLPYIK